MNLIIWLMGLDTSFKIQVSFCHRTKLAGKQDKKVNELEGKILFRGLITKGISQPQPGKEYGSFVRWPESNPIPDLTTTLTNILLIIPYIYIRLFKRIVRIINSVWNWIIRSHWFISHYYAWITSKIYQHKSKTKKTKYLQWFTRNKFIKKHHMIILRGVYASFISLHTTSIHKNYS